MISSKLPATVLLLSLLTVRSAAPSDTVRSDVVVYGATPGGIAAAVAAGRSGRTVLLLEPTARIGGLTTSGLSHSDFHSFESLSGTFLEFSQRVLGHYERTYGVDSPQVRDSFRGTHGEPKVNLAIFEAMLTEQPSIEVRTLHRLKSVTMEGAREDRQIREVTFVGPDEKPLSVHGRVYIDATYEGDLMAMAGVSWRVGREGRDEYGESLAPEQPDDQLQAYNFRFIMTRDADNCVVPSAPPGYRREDFLPLLELLPSEQMRRVFDYPGRCLFKAHEPALPNGKHDINDVSRGLVRLSLPGHNRGWPNGSIDERNAIFADHLRDQAGLLFFLQNDHEVPTELQEEARQWGWCRDEFVETDHLPPQLYVREARRMVGRHVFVQADSEYADADVRAVYHPEAIAMADYGNNCHGTAHEGPRFGGRHTGEFYNPVPPYQIPYGVLLPRDVGNLLVPVAASSSHVGFCALRLEPVWMSLGQAAGHAAALAVEAQQNVQDVDVARLQDRLHKDQSATIYISDVPPGAQDFAVVQWWGTAGGFQRLDTDVARRTPRGQKITSQYSEAAPDHAAELDRVLTPAIERRWRSIAQNLGLPGDRLPSSDSRLTRGEFLRTAWTLFYDE